MAVCDCEGCADLGSEAGENPAGARVETFDRRLADPCDPQRARPGCGDQLTRRKRADPFDPVVVRVDPSEHVALGERAPGRLDTESEDTTGRREDLSGVELAGCQADPDPGIDPFRSLVDAINAGQALGQPDATCAGCDATDRIPGRVGWRPQARHGLAQPRIRADERAAVAIDPDGRPTATVCGRKALSRAENLNGSRSFSLPVTRSVRRSIRRIMSRSKSVA